MQHTKGLLCVCIYILKCGIKYVLEDVKVLELRIAKLKEAGNLAKRA